MQAASFSPIPCRLRGGVVLWMLCGLVTPAAAQDVAAETQQDIQADAAQGGRIDFDIPAQPLGDALDRYAAVSGRTVLFRSELVSGRRSSALVGRYASGAALEHLLVGTGLAVRKSSGGPADAFILVEAAKAAVSAGAAGTAYDGIDGLVADRRYPGRVQARIWQALCGDPRTAPGAYRSLLRFRLDDAGRLRDVRVLEATGDTRRDDAIVDALTSLRVAPPPADVAEKPLTMLIEPASQGGPRCVQEAGQQ